MRIKTFRGRTLEELLPEIRAELGPGAVVLGQRQTVQGGVGGFFGTKVVEVTAADQMPGDDALVALDEDLGQGDAAPPSRAGDDEVVDVEETARRLRAAMSMGRTGGVDEVDSWDPSTDAELAEEYGRVLEHARQASVAIRSVRTHADGDIAGFTGLDLPTLPAAGDASVVDPAQQARELVERTHRDVEAATGRVESTGAYGPPVALPRSGPEHTTTFAAEVVDADPPYVPTFATTATPVEQHPGSDHVLSDLVPTAPDERDRFADALAAVVDSIDARAIDAVRSALGTPGPTARLQLDIPLEPDVQRELDGAIADLRANGVDDDVVAAISDKVRRHRLPFARTTSVVDEVRTAVEEIVPVRTGVPSTGRTYVAALVGPSSAGKSTTCEKLAHGYRATGMTVGVLRLGAAADRATAIDGVEVRVATTPDEAREAMAGFGARDMVLVDTPGSTYLDRRTAATVSACLDAIGIDDAIVVVPLTTSTREAVSIVEAFAPLGANRLVVTKLDETRYAGQLVNYGFHLGLPIAFLSDGPRVPEDLRATSARAIASLVMPEHEH